MKHQFTRTKLPEAQGTHFHIKCLLSQIPHQNIQVILFSKLFKRFLDCSILKAKKIHIKVFTKNLSWANFRNEIFILASYWALIMKEFSNFNAKYVHNKTVYEWKKILHINHLSRLKLLVFIEYFIAYVTFEWVFFIHISCFYTLKCPIERKFHRLGIKLLNFIKHFIAYVTFEWFVFSSI